MLFATSMSLRIFCHIYCLNMCFFFPYIHTCYLDRGQCRADRGLCHSLLNKWSGVPCLTGTTISQSTCLIILSLFALLVCYLLLQSEGKQSIWKILCMGFSSHMGYGKGLTYGWSSRGRSPWALVWMGPILYINPFIFILLFKIIFNEFNY